MSTIEIQVAEYYNKPKFYGFMPEEIFNALEAAFIEGKDTAGVPAEAFNLMLKQFYNEENA